MLHRVFAVMSALLVAGCGADVPTAPSEPATWVWTLPVERWPAGLLSVSGTAADDVWVTGAPHEGHATVLHWDGDGWEVLAPPVDTTLWWVHALDSETVFFGGERGVVLRWSPGGFERLQTPALARQTVFGVWARAADDVYAVGGIGDRTGFIWHFDGTDWTELPLPDDLPRLYHGEAPALFKVWGDASSVWVVGGRGQILRRDGEGPFALIAAEGEDTLFTVAGDPVGGEVLAVGGGATCRIDRLAPRPDTERLEGVPLLQGVTFDPDGHPWASGAFGTILRREDDAWRQIALPFTVPGESLHAVWIDPEGGVWAAGGNVLSARLDAGVLVHGAPPASDRAPSTLAVTPPEPEPPSCPDPLPDLGAGSTARLWNEQTLGAIRRALPEPTVHARNLYHVSLALHDAWAAFEAEETGLVRHEHVAGDDTGRMAAMSHAAHRLLVHRYAHRTGGQGSVICFRNVMEALGLDPDDEDLDGDGPSAVGNRIGQAVIDAFAEDGANEDLDYQDPDYRFANPSLVVDDPGIDVDDIDTWQPLDLAVAVTQNGIPEASGPQSYIGPHWGAVVPFAIRREAPGEAYFDGGPRPVVADPRMGEWVEQVIRQTAALDVDDGVMMDISPGAYGNNSLGQDDGAGHSVNPITGQPYAPVLVPRGDFGRVLAEYWADGPNSETPPGHWNVLAHAAFATPGFERRWGGVGEPLESLAWDVRAFLVLNGALHDAAIVAWETKRLYESARPISLIRWMAARGQRSEPDADDYDAEGLPLVPGLIERITAESAAPGQRHAHLSRHVGELALWSWPGDPGDPESQRSTFRWIRAATWVPYQPRTFVTPAFPGFVSGHSTFSRSAADVLTAITGTPFVPGGLSEHVVPRDHGLEFERGPSVEVSLQWATWQDAADQAGQSRIWGGIHIVPDDHVGRLMGAMVATRAIAWADARFGDDPGVERPGIPTGRPEDVPIVPEPDDDTPVTFPAVEGDPADGDTELGIGTGRTAFEALMHGDTLRWEAGVQGGFHVWLTAAIAPELAGTIPAVDLNGLRTRFTLHRADGDLLADLSRLGGYRDGAAGLELWGSFSILRPGLRPGRLDDEPLHLVVTLELPGGRTLSRAVWVRSACCD